MRFIFITGGVVSGLGKGIAAASIGKLLKSTGESINIIKLDPYLQVDAGTMSPYEHGEVFVTEDGFETDLDIGHYERFLNQNMTKNSSITTGQIYQSILENERKGKYLGQTVQVIPHVTNEVKNHILKDAKKFDVTIVEIGGTIGDIEGPHFIEAIRQMRHDFGYEKTMYIHLAPIIFLKFSGEMKTKPIQHSVKELTRLGIQPDMLMCRTEYPLTKKIKEKLSLFCNMSTEYIIEAIDVESIYQVPRSLESQEVTALIQQRLGLAIKKPKLKKRNEFTNNFLHPKSSITIGIVAKYAELQDAYLSVIESLKHAGAHHETKINIHRMPAEEFENRKKIEALFSENIIQGILVPGGFGIRGMEGKIKAAQFCREQKKPYLGLCLGLQMAVIEFSRNVCGLEKANTVEAKPHCKTPVISWMPGQSDTIKKGGSMRLGSYTTKLQKGSLVEQLYKKSKITERHRHRFEVNPDYYELLENNGMILSGRDEKTKLVEFIELPHHPYFIATQSHPEFKSRLDAPHPLFIGFVKACLAEKREKHSLNITQ